MQIASGLHRVGSEIVNSYLVVDQNSVTIIDAGLPGYWEPAPGRTGRTRQSLDDVPALILTHGDRPHRLRRPAAPGDRHRRPRSRGARRPRACLKVKKPNSGWGPVKIGPLAGFLWYSARRGGLRIKPATELRTVADNDVLDVPGSPRIIHTPGHTPGSIAVHVSALDALFLGDTMTTCNVLTGVTGPKPAPFTLEPK